MPITKVEVVGNKLVVSGNDLIDLHGIFYLTIRHHRSAIMEFLNHIGGRFPEVIDWDEYEGGVDSWWGISSVFCMELGLEITLKIKNMEFMLTVE